MTPRADARPAAVPRYPPGVTLPRRLLRLAATLLLLSAAAGSAAGADDPLEVALRTGARFKGRVASSDESGFLLKGAEGGEFRIAWKDLDERSWLTVKRAVTPAGDGAALLALARYAADKSFRSDAESLVTLAVRADAALRPEADGLRPRLEELRRADARTLFERGKRMLEEKKYLHALGRFREARELDPANALVANGIGEAQYHLRRLRDSRAAMNEAIALDAQCKDAILNLAWLDLLELDFPSCLKGLERVIGIPPTEGRVGSRGELDERAKAEKVAKPEEAWERFADAALIQARDLEPVIRGIVNGPGFATEYRAVTPHYDLRTDVSQEYADEVAALMETIHAEYERRFGFSKTGETKTRGKDLRFPVLVFRNRQGYVDWFGKVLRNPGLAAMTGGVYVSAVKHLVFFQYDTMDNTRLVAWHEGFHQYLDHFIEGAPHWFNEGQAEYFGASGFDAAKKKVRPGQTNAWRIDWIEAMLAKRRLPEARWLMQTDAATFMRPQPDPKYGKSGESTVGEHYAAAWALVHFCLDGEGGRWQKTFLSYFKALCDGAAHEEAFEKAWGRVGWERFQEAFTEHCRWLVARHHAEKAGKPVPPAPR